jgi:TetR/AcrR family transcriptional regulator, transcriptional repressor for nem operon
MRYPDTRKEETRARIVEGAAAQLRAAGVNGIGVADLMRSVGLTHGGFYAHFESKEALVAEALDAALDQTMGYLRAAAEAAPKNAARQAIAESYLSAKHRDQPDKGCGIAALGADIARLSPATRAVFDQKLEQMIALIAEHSGARADARRKAIGMIATMVGALVMARAVKSRPLSEEILEAARETV